MRLCIYLLFLLLIGVGSVYGQTDTLPALRKLFNQGNTVDSVIVRPDSTYWRHKLEAGFNLNQGSFSGNWKGGGVNSIALGLLLNARLSYRRNRFNWSASTQLQYGIVKNAQQTLRKNTDRLYADTKAGYRLSTRWQWFGSLNLLTQFAPGYDYVTLPSGQELANPISNLFAPAYLTESLGLSYEPNDVFDLRLGVFTVRQTFVTDPDVRLYVPRNYGVPLDQTVRTELAFQAIFNYDQDIAQNVNLKFRYLFFADYRDFKASDHRLDFTLTGKINKFLNATLSGVVLYDQDQDFKIQYSQALSAGLLFTW
ncbi:DUF3078 domain-containing protein [Spirosoma pollinicola]|uniref:DUF3078 domain-containing protein n=1 Tax=Spirosoma pollinicola TaxID=2057025 RepID=A0A2K8ZCI9_9BACT|nr:DUF3078 domain-containing protein [Spirosoma pollinicola]AUD07573.1 hypothetical protein CWM47_31090 [Spirosoma pollinicola]